MQTKGYRNKLSKSKVFLPVVLVVFLIFMITATGAAQTILGDINGDGRIDVKDVVLIQKHILGKISLTAQQREVADVNGDGLLDARDVALMMQRSIGKISTFPLQVNKVDDVNLTVYYGTAQSNINFPATVSATISDGTKRDLNVQWETTSTPPYNPNSYGSYVFHGNLINLPSGITNPNAIKAKATVSMNYTPGPGPIPPYQYYSLNVSASPTAGGSASGTGTYLAGTGVPVTATAGTGYSFVNWTVSGLVVSTNPSFTYFMPANNVNLVANFTSSTLYTLDLEVYPLGSGTVTGSGSYSAGTVVNVSAFPATGYEFDRWAIGTVTESEDSSFNYTMPASDITMVAYFSSEMIEVLNVEAIDRTTIEVVLAADVDPAKAGDVNEYYITVGGVEVIATNVVFDSVTKEATLTVDLTGLAGTCTVNGVASSVDVPLAPIFDSIVTVAGSYDIVMYFNTEVYDPGSTLVPGDFTVLTDGNSNPVASIDAADNLGDAETIITLTMTDPAIGGTSTSVFLKSSGAAKILNSWDEPTAAATRAHLTPVDEDAPLFTGVRAVGGGYVIYLDFSEPVHTAGQDVDVNSGSDLIRVSVDGVRVDIVDAFANGTSVFTSGSPDVIAVASSNATATMKLDLDLAYDDLLQSGDLIVVTLDQGLQDVLETNHIRDLSDNVFTGQRERTATIIGGAGLEDAEASTLLYNGEEDLDLSVTLDGALAAGETITVYLEDLDDNGFNFVNGAVTVTGSTGTAEITDTDKVVFAAPVGGVPDATELTFTIEEGGAAGEYVFDGTTDAVDNSPHDIVFQRSDVGTIAETEVIVIEGFSGFSADDLVTSKDDQPFSFQFNIDGALSSGNTVEMDLAALAAKVDFSDVDVTETEQASTIGGSAIDTTNHTLTKSGDTLIITAGSGDIADASTIVINLRDSVPSANIIDVASGATGQHDLTLTRDDSGASAPFKVTVLANITNGSASNLANNTNNQTQNFYFTVDGDLAMNQFVDIKIADSKTVAYTTTLTHYQVTGANAQVVSVSAATDPTIRVRANELISSGTELTLNVGGATGVDTTGVNDTIIEVEIERLDNNESDVFTFEVGTYTGTVMVYDALSLQNALNDPDISIVILAGDITGGPFAANIDGQTIDGDGYTITGNLTINGDNVSMSSITIDGDLTINGDDFTGSSVTITGTTTINGANASFSSTLNDILINSGGSSTFTNVTITGNLTVNAGGSATLLGSTTVAGTVSGDGEIDASGSDVLQELIDGTTMVAEFDDVDTVTVTITYPEEIDNVLTNYMTDALITSDVAFQDETEIAITYNGSPLGTATMVGDTDEIYLSDLLILAGIPEANTRTPIIGHAGREDIWGFEILTPAELNATVTIQSVVSDDDFVLEVIIADDIIEVDMYAVEITALSLIYSKYDSFSPAEEVYSAGGDLLTGYSLILDNSDDYYYIDVETDGLESTLLLKDGLYEFYVNPDQQDMGDYWDPKGVNSSASGGWEEIMYNILTAEDGYPIFYLKVSSNGTGFMLVDGLQYLLDESQEPLRINGDYPRGEYDYTGNVTGINNIVSADIVANITISIPVP